ncbi:hypothetical protein BRADI_3g39021v3 [Brachypodium distachyon]|uniref:Uncharacterized protein n=1 Tax=Brachypodium distachyon TaxID=15368 RepID=A0A0Q3QAQ5_BRADI|nr:hypothetical protein BRADI_3g39021v3 [Brachypodium distachyon]
MLFCQNTKWHFVKFLGLTVAWGEGLGVLGKTKCSGSCAGAGVGEEKLEGPAVGGGGGGGRGRGSGDGGKGSPCPRRRQGQAAGGGGGSFASRERPPKFRPPAPSRRRNSSRPRRASAG